MMYFMCFLTMIDPDQENHVKDMDENTMTEMIFDKNSAKISGMVN